MSEQSGFLLIDKPGGASSFDVVRQLRRITGTRKIGHTGTLDPFATGLLICAIGSYTRMCKFLEAQDKTYSATLRLGSQTITGDIEGGFIKQGEPIPTKIDPEALREQALQIRELLPPQHSALKVQGRPAYVYARQGREVELDPRPVTVHEFEVREYAPPDLSYFCRVSKGTYIRSLSEFLAQYLGTVGHTVRLRREAIGGVSVDEAHALDTLNPDNFQAAFHPLRMLFSGFEFRCLSGEDLNALRRGQSIAGEGPDNYTILLLDSNESLLGVARREAGTLAPVINLV